MLPPAHDCKTFLQYAEGVFIPFVLNSQPSTAKRIDIVWNRYFENSLKVATRKNRGRSVHRKVNTNGILLHTQHTARTFPRILIKTIDSDVIVIAIAAFNKIEGITELWIEFGKGKTLKYLPIHEISEGLGIPKSRVMPFFMHSSVDVTQHLQYSEKGKKSFYETWTIIPEITETFVRLSQVADVTDITDTDFKMLEKFFVVMYCPTLNTDEINMARRILFTWGGRSLENIPPTAGTLKQYILLFFSSVDDVVNVFS